MKETTCDLCGEGGHWMAQCPRIGECVDRNQDGTAKQRERPCFNCATMGHIILDCPYAWASFRISRNKRSFFDSIKGRTAFLGETPPHAQLKRQGLQEAPPPPKIGGPPLPLLVPSMVTNLYVAGPNVWTNDEIAKVLGIVQGRPNVKVIPGGVIPSVLMEFPTELQAQEGTLQLHNHGYKAARAPPLPATTPPNLGTAPQTSTQLTAMPPSPVPNEFPSAATALVPQGTQRGDPRLLALEKQNKEVWGAIGGLKESVEVIRTGQLEQTSNMIDLMRELRSWRPTNNDPIEIDGEPTPALPIQPPVLPKPTPASTSGPSPLPHPIFDAGGVPFGYEQGNYLWIVEAGGEAAEIALARVQAPATIGGEAGVIYVRLRVNNGEWETQEGTVSALNTATAVSYDGALGVLDRAFAAKKRRVTRSQLAK
jgi:hypothetical protein